MLVRFEADYDEETTPYSTPKPLKIYVEMERLQSAPESKQVARANSPQEPLMATTMFWNVSLNRLVCSTLINRRPMSAHGLQI